MRLKRLRRARKIVSFFKSAGHFKPPYDVLLDGTAIQAALHLEISLEEALPKVLGDKVRLLVPKAVVAELHVLGRKFAQAAKFARRLKVLPSEDEQPSASAALLSLVANGNPHRRFVMSEDKELCKALGELRSVPILRFARNQIVLELPAGRLAATSAMAPAAPKHSLAGPASSGGSGGGSGGGGGGSSAGGKGAKGSSGDRGLSGAADQGAATTATGTGGAEATAAPAKKRKRQKDPNPLSCKKKKRAQGGEGGVASAGTAQPSGGHGDEDTASGAPKKKVRRGGKKKANGAGLSSTEV